MDRRHCLWLAIGVAACGSGSTTATPTPPSPGSPASITIASGDGQTGSPGTALPVALSVLVKDASGTPVPSAVVHFAIDSGGGSLSSASVTTGANGMAGTVIWTLGSSGRNVVVVTLASLAPLRFHAQATGVAARTVINNQTLGSSGGTLSYTQAGDPLSGLTITVPANAYTAASSWTITADSSIAVPLPSGFALVGPPLVIGNGQGFADSMMTLTMPMRLGNAVAAAPFYFDPVTRLLEPIALVDRTDSTATLATKHFSVDYLALPNANGTSALRGLSSSGFGNVVVVWVSTPLSQLIGTWSSGFQPGTDDWEFSNYGDYIGPGGDCEGMSITEMYYYYSFRRGGATAPGLYHRYDQSLPNQWDNVPGIRYAGSVQGDLELALTFGMDQEAALNRAAVARGANVQLLTSSWIALSIKLTHQPVLIALYRPGAGHAVVAYSVALSGLGFTTVSIANPNEPGTTQFINFTAGVFQPTNFSTVAGATANNYNIAYALGVSSELPIPVIALRWLQFRSGLAGADRYPKGYTVQWFDSYDVEWRTLTTHKLLSYDSTITLRTSCAACGAGSPALPVEPAIVWDARGASRISADGTFEFLTPGTNSVFAIEYGYNGTDNTAGFLDSDSLEVTWQKVSIEGPGVSPPGQQLTFTVINPPNVSGTHYTYSWDFGDTTAVVTKNDNPVVTHKYTAAGNYTVRLTITVTGSTATIFFKAVSQRITADIVWSFTNVTQTATTLPPGGIGPESTDTLVQGLINGFMTNLQTNPTNSLLYLLGDASGCHSAIFEQFPGATNPTTDALVQSTALGVWASNCNLQPYFVSTLTLGPLGNGQVTGTAVDSPQLPVDTYNVWHGGSITATMTNAILQGSVTWNVLYSTGIAVYRFTFKAIQMVP